MTSFRRSCKHYGVIKRELRRIWIYHTLVERNMLASMLNKFIPAYHITAYNEAMDAVQNVIDVPNSKCSNPS